MRRWIIFLMIGFCLLIIMLPFDLNAEAEIPVAQDVAGEHDELLLDLPFEGTVEDMSPLQHPVTVKGVPQFSPGRNSTALQLESNDFHHYSLDLGNSDRLKFGDRQSFTVMFWIRTLDVLHTINSDDAAIIANKDWSSGNKPGWAISLRNKNIHWNFKTSDSVRKDAVIPNIRDGKWHHIAIVTDRTNEQGRLYKDGRQISDISLAGVSGTVDTPYNIHIGADGLDQVDGNLKIQLDDMLLYGKAMASTEISEKFNEYVLKVTGIRMNKSTLRMKTQDSAPLQAEIDPAEATNSEVNWSSSNDSVATVVVYGGKATVTALKPGTAIISAVTEDGGFAATTKVIVEKAQLPRLRVMTYNIRHGEGMDGKINLKRIASIIKSLKPDIVALQEVDKHALRSKNTDQSVELGRLTGMHAYFGKAISLPAGGDYGQAILSRYKLKNPQVVSLPVNSGQEARILVTTQVSPERIPEMTFIGTHLTFEVSSSGIQYEQAKVLVRDFGEQAPLVLAGDMNALTESNIIRLMRSKWSDATDNITDWTNNTDGKIDYIMYGRSDQWREVATLLIYEDTASDHRPILSVLEWTGKGK